MLNKLLPFVHVGYYFPGRLTLAYSRIIACSIVNFASTRSVAMYFGMINKFHTIVAVSSQPLLKFIVKQLNFINIESSVQCLKSDTGIALTSIY